MHVAVIVENLQLYTIETLNYSGMVDTSSQNECADHQLTISNLIFTALKYHWTNIIQEYG